MRCWNQYDERVTRLELFHKLEYDLRGLKTSVPVHGTVLQEIIRPHANEA